MSHILLMHLFQPLCHSQHCPPPLAIMPHHLTVVYKVSVKTEFHNQVNAEFVTKTSIYLSNMRVIEKYLTFNRKTKLVSIQNFTFNHLFYSVVTTCLQMPGQIHFTQRSLPQKLPKLKILNPSIWQSYPIFLRFYILLRYILWKREMFRNRHRRRYNSVNWRHFLILFLIVLWHFLLPNLLEFSHNWHTRFLQLP